MAKLHVGLPALTGGLERYAERFDLVELHPGDESTPRPVTLRAWRKTVSPSFVFSVVLPRAVGLLKPGAELDKSLGEALEVAREVQARCIVLTTPPEVTPTDVNRKRLAAVVEKLPRDAVALAWEPRGLWEIEESAALAAKLGLVLVVDASRDPVPRGTFAYVRLRGLGESTRLGPADLEKISMRLEAVREAFVIIEMASPVPVAQALRRAQEGGGRPGSRGAVIRPRVTLRTEDEEQ